MVLNRNDWRFSLVKVDYVFDENGRVIEEKFPARRWSLLFGKAPKKFFISARTRVGRFKTPVDIIDTVIAEGNLFKQLEVTIEAIKKHSSYPRNPLIAYTFYLAGLIEKWGSGTKRIVDLCKEQGLPEPEYKEEHGGFSVWFYKDIYTEENLKKMGLNERQIKAVMFTKQNERITNTEYQTICNVKKRQATNDLLELEKIKILKRIGTTGKGTYYILEHQRGKRGNEGVSKGQKTRQKSGEK